MNITESTIYWLSRLDHIKEALWELGFFSSIATLISAMATIITIVMLFCGEFPDARNTFKKAITCGASAFAFFLICNISIMCAKPFVPTTKEMCAIKVIPAIANNQSVKELGEGIVNLAKEWMNELRPKSAAKGK